MKMSDNIIDLSTIKGWTKEDIQYQIDLGEKMAKHARLTPVKFGWLRKRLSSKNKDVDCPKKKAIIKTELAAIRIIK